jgi:hypothetical protein
MDVLDRDDIPYLLVSIRDSLRQLVEQGKWFYVQPNHPTQLPLRINRLTGAMEELVWRGGEGYEWLPLQMRGEHDA